MKRTAIMSQKYVLRDLVLTSGGRMFKNSIRMHHSFRGWVWPAIYRLVFALRDDFRGIDGPYGYECWEIIGDEVIALESKLTLRERDQISHRTHARHAGSGERTIQQNIIFGGRIKKELSDGAAKLESLEESSKNLGLIVRSSLRVTATPIEQLSEPEIIETLQTMEAKEVELGTLPDGSFASLKFWAVESEGRYDFYTTPVGDEISWLECQILRHAKNGRSVLVSGEAFGRGIWLPADAKAVQKKGS